MWNGKTRKLEFTLGGHTASVNVVRWGGEGVIYTASSDRTVKLWSGKDVSRAEDIRMMVLTGSGPRTEQADPHTERSRTLGQHDGTQYRLHPPHRTL